MARQTGPLSLAGKLGELSFYYNKQHGYLVRQKGGPSSEMVAKDQRFARTRENSSEFASASAAGKLIRQALRSATGLTGDGNVTQRLVSLLISMGKSDTISERGKRSAVNVFAAPSSRQMLNAFSFYKSYPLGQIFPGEISCDPEAGSILFDERVPVSALKVPDAATHVKIMSAIVILDFESPGFQVCKAPDQIIRLGSSSPLPTLSCDMETAGAGFSLGVAGFVFMQEKNGEFYLLHDRMSLGVI